MSKTTSLTKVTDALKDHGWTVEVTETKVYVRDHESDKVVRGYGGRVRYAPSKSADAVSVRATNGIEDTWQRKTFTMTFLAENGSYLRAETKGAYDFVDQPLKDVLRKIERLSPAATKARLAEQQAEQQADDEKEVAEVAEAYAAALEQESHAAAALAEEFLSLGLTEAQAAAVLAMHAPETPLTDYLNSKTQRERIGSGWLPSKSYVTGVYVDGKRVQ